MLCILIPYIYNYFHKTKHTSDAGVFALLIAGSKGIENYRHQADVAHAYHVLVSKGFPPENIVTMMYDDVVNLPGNPFPGELRSHPKGRDYYKGLRIDYRGEDVNVKVFKAVLTGNAYAVQHKGTGRVVESDKTDNIFLYYVDHGHEGLLGMPTGEYLTKRSLQEIISKAKFHAMSIYIEACHAASVLEGYENNPIVYGLAASAANQNSFAFNCIDGICYTDEFSNAWMTDTEKNNVIRSTLGKQMNRVKHNVLGSTVINFGEKQLYSLSLNDFQGCGRCTTPLPKPEGRNDSDSDSDLIDDILAEENLMLKTMPATEISMYHYKWKLATATTPGEKLLARQKLADIQNARVQAEQLISRIVSSMNAIPHYGNISLDFQNDCFESLVDEFSKNCYKLGSNPYFTQIIGRIRNSIQNPVCSQYLEIIRRICVEHLKFQPLHLQINVEVI